MEIIDWLKKYEFYLLEFMISNKFKFKIKYYLQNWIDEKIIVK